METPQENEPIKSVDNRRPDGTFGPHNNANPEGRPKGKTLKEYQAQEFREMTDEEKKQWLETHKVSGETRWKMAEGNPHQATDLTSGGKPIPILGYVSNNNSNQQDSPIKEEN